jgi:hypothetical protein
LVGTTLHNIGGDPSYWSSLKIWSRGIRGYLIRASWFRWFINFSC